MTNNVYTLFNAGKIIAGVGSRQQIADGVKSYSATKGENINDPGEFNTGVIT